MCGRLYDFNRHPIAPLGTRVVVHDKHRATWAPHGVDGFSVGPTKLEVPRMFQVHTNYKACSHVRMTNTDPFAALSDAGDPDTSLSRDNSLVARAIQALHTDDITGNNANKYRHAVEEAADLSNTDTHRHRPLLRHSRSCIHYWHSRAHTLPAAAKPPLNIAPGVVAAAIRWR
jgi:hypothetical protein